MFRSLSILSVAAVLVGCGDKTQDPVPDSTAATMTPPAAEASGTPNAEMRQILDTLGALGGKPIPTLTPAEARQQPTPADAVTRILLAQGKDTASSVLVPGVTSLDRTIPGPAGALPVRIYTPDGDGPFPVIVYYHGGGWVIGNKAVYDGGARGLSKGANAVVVSVDYRLAPEHKFPAQHDDALATYRWALANAASIKGDPARVALAGESAGGNLAVATAVAAVAQKLQLPTHVLSVYPIAQADTTTPSYVRFADAKPLNRPMMAWFLNHTAGAPADLADPRISLVGASLAGLPPVTIVSAGVDPLLSDADQLETALRAAGVSVERRTWGGATHEFFGMAAVLADAREAQAFASDRLKASFAN
ncbi:MAG: alpha/beta hydrolase [Gemmatimonadales bacterium]|nr:alpha/beta hydrolase [Gemmatimonadales bacterium]